MFDVLDRPLLWIPVRWPGLKPGGDGTGLAEAVENEIEVCVELKEKDDVKPLFDPEEGEALEKLDAFMTFATGWRKIIAGGQQLEFSRENADLLIRSQLPFFDAFTFAYLEACLGRVEIREGNSDASPAGGRAAGAAKPTTGNRRQRRTAKSGVSTPKR
jgi:hypothetical protein